MADDTSTETAGTRGGSVGRAALEAAGLNLDEAGIARLVADLLHLADDPAAGSTDGWTLLRSARSIYGSEAPSADELNLARAKALVLQTVPNAAVLRLETSDQSSYGFVLSGLDDDRGEDIDIDDQDTLEDALWPYLCNLSWDGVVGEDRQGCASVPLSSASA